MKITKEWLKEKKACREGIDWFISNFPNGGEIKPVCKKLLAEHFNWANWLVVQKMSRKQNLQYMVFIADLTLCKVEAKFPADKIPRRAIQAAKKVSKNDTIKNRKAANIAACEAYVPPNVASYAAFYVANIAAEGYFIDDTTGIAELAADASAEAKRKIINYGLRLIEGENK